MSAVVVGRETVMTHVISKDGTRIAYERMGSGPALVLVDGAMCSRAFGPMPKIAALLKEHFTVYLYDRRGRGESGDTQPYSKAREVEDIEALIRAAGGSAFALGLSSGAALALEAAASGSRVREARRLRAAVHARRRGASRERRSRGQAEGARRRADERGAAVKYFMRDMVGVPAPFVLMMQVMRGVWGKLKAVAHTLPYDAAIMGNWQVPAARLAGVRDADARDARRQDGDAPEARRRRAREGAAERSPSTSCRGKPTTSAPPCSCRRSFSSSRSSGR